MHNFDEFYTQQSNNTFCVISSPLKDAMMPVVHAQYINPLLTFILAVTGYFALSKRIV